MYLILEKGFRTGYITEGYTQLIELYHLTQGGWLKVWYVGKNVFYMRVRDINLQRIRYPVPPIKLELDVMVDVKPEVDPVGDPEADIFAVGVVDPVPDPVAEFAADPFPVDIKDIVVDLDDVAGVQGEDEVMRDVPNNKGDEQPQMVNVQPVGHEIFTCEKILTNYQAYNNSLVICLVFCLH